MDIKVDGSNNIVQYPYTLGNLRADNPNISFPADSMSRADIRSSYNIHTVHPVTRPADTATTYQQFGSPVWNGSQWNESWVAVEYTAEELTLMENGPAEFA